MARKYVAMRCFRFTFFGGKIIHNHTMKWKKYDLLSQVWGVFGFDENPLERHWRLEVCVPIATAMFPSVLPLTTPSTSAPQFSPEWRIILLSFKTQTTVSLTEGRLSHPKWMNSWKSFNRGVGGDNLICFVFWMDILAFKSYSGNSSLVCGWDPPKNTCFFRVGCHRKTLLNHQLIFRDMRLRFYWMFHLASAVLPTLPVLE